MSNITYENMSIDKTPPGRDGRFTVFGDYYLQDRLIHKNQPIADFLIYRSAKTFMEHEEERRKLHLEESKIQQQTAADKPGENKATGQTP